MIPASPSIDAEQADRLRRRAAMASSSLALVLLAIKGWAAVESESLAMAGSLADTALDLVASLATLLGVWVAATPADSNHRFGHGKAEALAAMFQVVLMSLSALALAWTAIGALLAGRGAIDAAPEGIASIAGVVLTLALVTYQRHVLRQTGSVAIAADHLHYQADLLLNIAVLLSIALAWLTGWRGIDASFALAIAGWLGWGAYSASQEAIEQLMDQEWPLDKRERFLAVAAQHPELRGIHDLRTRTSGRRDFVQFHVWLDGQMTVSAAHRVMDEIEELLHRQFPDLEVFIHPDPEGLVDEEPMAAQDLLASGTETPALLAQGPAPGLEF